MTSPPKNPVDWYEYKKLCHADALRFVQRFHKVRPTIRVVVIDGTVLPYDLPRDGGDRDGRNETFSRAMSDVIELRFADLAAEALALMKKEADAAAEAARDAAKSLLAELDKP